MSQTELFEKCVNEEPPDASDLTGLFEISVDAYFAALHARMSCLPIEQEISRYIEKVKKAAGGMNAIGINAGEERVAAARAALDRGDPDALAVLTAASKALHEIHRLTGLLRFSPDRDGVYVARCAPDHFILPALADHFTLRFGEMPWAIIDEKRGLCLRREKGAPARLVPVPPEEQSASAKEGDSWEGLWRLYHRSVNNESRKNPRLQRQFMPKRYHEYLPETKP